MQADLSMCILLAVTFVFTNLKFQFSSGSMPIAFHFNGVSTRCSTSKFTATTLSLLTMRRTTTILERIRCKEDPTTILIHDP
jgi:hypothetical protein